MINQTLVFDVDGVLLRWNSRLVEFLSQHMIVPQWIINSVKQDDFIPFGEIENLLPNFLHRYHTSTYGQNLSIFEDSALTIMTQLHKKYNLIALSNFSTDPKAVSNRKINLEQIYGTIFSQVICIDPLVMKSSVLPDLDSSHNIKLFIDDSQSQILSAQEVLGKDKCFHFANKGQSWRDLTQILEI